MENKWNRSDFQILTNKYSEGDAAEATWRGRRRRGPASFQRGGEHAAERTE